MRATILESRVHVDRTPRCHRHHRHLGRHAAARASESEGKRRTDQVLEQPQANRVVHAALHR